MSKVVIKSNYWTFNNSHICCDEHAHAEMERTKDKSSNSLFDWQHPLSVLYGNKICLFNIRAWSAYIKQFPSDNVYTCHGSFLSFMEINFNSRYSKNVIPLKQWWSEIQTYTAWFGYLLWQWKSQDHHTIWKYQLHWTFAILPVFLEVDNGFLLVIFLYCTAPPGTFMDTLQRNGLFCQVNTEQLYYVILIWIPY